MTTLNMPLYWESGCMITDLNLPRRYTSTHDDNKAELYLTVGHHYNKKQLDIS